MEEDLWHACSDGNVEEVIQLLQNEQININWQDPELSRTPLYRACGHSGNIEIVKLLLNDQRLIINKVTNVGATPFFIACQNGHIDIVKLLLNDSRVDINQALNDGLTPFYVACQEGQTEVVKLLLNDDRVDINQATNDDWTPLLIACYIGQTEVVKHLLESGREIDINKTLTGDWTPFYVACQKGHTEIVKLLLNDDRVDINKANNNGTTPFYIAYQEGNTEIINVLRNEKNKLNFEEEANKYNQNLQQNKDIINAIANLSDILFYFPESITLEIKHESIRNFVQAFKNCQEDQKRAFFWVIENISLNDEFTRIFKDVGGVNVLPNSFIQSNKKNQEAILVSMRNIVHNPLFCKDLEKNSEFLNSLKTLLNETKDVQSKSNITRILFCLEGNILNNDQNQNQQMKKDFNKMDGFEKGLQKMEKKFETIERQFYQIETQNKENVEALGKLEQKFEKLELKTQSEENLEVLEKIEQRLQKLETQNMENLEKMVHQQTKQKIIFVAVAAATICVCLFIRTN